MKNMEKKESSSDFLEACARSQFVIYLGAKIIEEVDKIENGKKEINKEFEGSKGRKG